MVIIFLACQMPFLWPSSIRALKEIIPHLEVDIEIKIISLQVIVEDNSVCGDYYTGVVNE